MKKVVLNASLFAGLLVASLTANAGIVTLPVGIQSDLTQTQIENWGWTECSRNVANSVSSVQDVFDNCNGNYLMMAAWDASSGKYGIAAAGEYDIVTLATYDSYYTDDDYALLDNWSNDVNWYRTSGHGSWGFTSIGSVALYSADLNLANGLHDNSSYGNSTSESSLGEIARGLSWHLHGNGGGDFSTGWGYNVTGNNWTPLYESMDARVFFTANIDVKRADIPEPSSLFLLGTSILLLARKSRK